MSISPVLLGRVCQSAGWTLVHFVWQGTLTALVLAVALAFLRYRSANTRYIVSFAALLAMAVLPAVTFLGVFAGGGIFPVPTVSTGNEDSSGGTAADATPFVVESGPSFPNTAHWRDQLERLIVPFLPGVVAAWALGVAIMAAWNAGGWLRMRRYVTRDVHPVSAHLQPLLLRVCKTLGVERPVQLVRSACGVSPMVAGALRPAILLPASMLTGLAPDQLEAIIAHEVAHIRRHDYLLNLLQTAIVTLLFYHPAAWWVSRHIRIEREHCCDDLAAAACGSPLLYARALTALEELLSPSLSLAMAAKGGVLYNRIQRLLEVPKPRPYGWGPLAAIAGITLLLGVAAALSPPVQAQDAVVSADKAELMGRVEDFFQHNYRDITARKTLEWGDVEKADNGNRSIRYMYRATIWDKEQMIMNEIYTFDAKGAVVDTKKIEGYPKKVAPPTKDTSTTEGMRALVEDFFKNNYRDITNRQTIEWGELKTQQNGNASIRYKYKATIWGKEKKINNQIFTFDPKGEFVSVEDAATQADGEASAVSSRKDFYTASIRVVDTEGKPVVGAAIGPWYLNPDGSRFRYGGHSTDEAGRFSFSEFPAGQTCGFNTDCVNGYTAVDTDGFAAKTGETLPEITVVLDKLQGNVTGKAVAQDGKPMPTQQFIVHALYGDGKKAILLWKTNEVGEFTFAAGRAGQTVKLLFEGNGAAYHNYVWTSEPLTIAPDTTVDLGAITCKHNPTGNRPARK